MHSGTLALFTFKVHLLKILKKRNVYHKSVVYFPDKL